MIYLLIDYLDGFDDVLNEKNGLQLGQGVVQPNNENNIIIFTM